MKKTICIVGALMAVGLQACKSVQQKGIDLTVKPGAVWQDTNQEVINAHGGGLLKRGKNYYWYGEIRGKSASEGVSVYSSKDLIHWENKGVALAKSKDTTSEIAVGGLMERPKVIFNEKTNKYVMWFHLELPRQGYKAARAGIAVSDNPTGPFTYLKSFRPNGNMSRDMTLFVDDDGSAYHIYSSRENYDLRVVKLTADYLDVTKEDTLLFSKHREAPAIFKKDGKYFLITSGCTGWDPNAATLHSASSIFGPWKLEGDPMRGPMAEKTFDGQSTYILTVDSKKNQYIFMADRWKPKDLKDSRYLWLPISFENGIPLVQWQNEWKIK